MSVYQWCCSIQEVLYDLNIAEPTNGNFLRFIKSASATIANRVGDFIPVTMAREYDEERGEDMWLDPLLSVSSIVNGTATLTASDYTLFPSGKHWNNGPYSRIHLEASAWADDVTITGQWGKYLLAESLGITGTHSGTTDTTLTISAASAEVSPGRILLIGSELVAVQAKLTSLTYTVERGINGTTAAAHASAAVYAQRVPDDVNYLAREMAALAYKKAQTGYTGRGGNEAVGESWYINEFPQALKDLRKQYTLGYV
jgi:hypothetical protein